jgi:Flp pilus assembly pilin Flp
MSDADDGKTWPRRPAQHRNSPDNLGATKGIVMNDLILNVKALVSLPADKRGVTALEYGLIASAVGAAIITAFATFSTALTGLFTTLAGYMAG